MGMCVGVGVFCEGFADDCFRLFDRSSRKMKEGALSSLTLYPP